MASTDTKAVTADQEKKFDWHQIKSFLPIISFVAIVAFFAVATGGLLITPRNITLIISGGFTLMIATVGVYMIMSMGCLDFSQGSMMGLSCAVVCFLSQYNPVIAILGGIATGAVIGLINAVFHVKGQIQSFVVTMCMMFLLRGVIAYVTTTSPVYAATYLTALATNTPLLIGITVAVLVVAYWCSTSRRSAPTSRPSARPRAAPALPASTCSAPRSSSTWSPAASPVSRRSSTPFASAP